MRLSRNRPLGARRASRRGFTLVELMIAIAAGLLVTIAAFAFAKAATRSFQQETRLANATLGTTLGFRRLVSDIQRASFLTTPNIQRDFRRPHPTVPGRTVPGTVCADPSLTIAGIQDLQGIRIQNATPNAQDNLNSITPNILTLTGSYASAEQYYVRSISSGGGTGPTVFLQPLSGAVRRTTTNAQVAGNANQLWNTVFAPGRLLRLVDQTGYQQFGVIAAAGVNGSGVNAIPFITLQNTPAIYLQSSTVVPPGVNPACKGIPGTGTGVLANVVNRVRYDVRSLAGDARYAQIYANANLSGSAQAAAWDANRRELVRSEIALDGSVIPNTQELVAEYAVDLNLGVTVATSLVNGAGVPNPVLQKFPPGHAQIISTWGRQVTVNPNQAGPERIRSVRVRLAVRSREADRRTTITPPVIAGTNPVPGAGGIYRYRLDNGNNWARVRTLQAEVTLPNQSVLAW